MAKLVGDLRARLGLDKSKYDKGLKDAQTSSSKFGSAIKKLGGILAAVFAIRAIINWGKESFKLYDIQAKAEKALLTALKGRTDIQQHLIAQAKSLQKTTLYGDEESIRAHTNLAMLLGQDEKALSRLLPLVQDLATAKFGGNLSTAADMVAKSVGSSTNALSRYGITIEGAVGSSERLEMAIAALNKQVGGQAAAAALVGTGSITQLKNAWNDFREDIAKPIVTGSFMDKFIGLLKAAVEAANILWNKMTGGANDFLNLTKEQLTAKKEELEIQKQILEARGYEKQAINDGLTGLKKFTPAARENREGIVATIKELDKVEKSIEEINILLKNASNIPPPDITDEGAITTINTLTEELKKEKEALNDINVADETAIRNQVEKINLLERYIKSLTRERGIVPISKEDIKKAVPVPAFAPGGFGADLNTLAPALATANHEFIALLLNMAAVQEKEEMLGRVTTDVFSGFADVISRSFMATGNVLKNFGKFFIDFIKGMIVKLVAAAIAALALAVVISLIPGLNVGMGAKMAKAVTFGATFKAGFGLMTGMASGGVIPGGYPNDTFPAFMTSGERVLTPAQNKNYESGGVHFTFDELGIRNDTIYFAVREAERKRGNSF